MGCWEIEGILGLKMEMREIWGERNWILPAILKLSKSNLSHFNHPSSHRFPSKFFQVATLETPQTLIRIALHFFQFINSCSKWLKIASERAATDRGKIRDPPKHSIPRAAGSNFTRNSKKLIRFLLNYARLLIRFSMRNLICESSAQQGGRQKNASKFRGNTEILYQLCKSIQRSRWVPSPIVAVGAISRTLAYFLLSLFP
jgi:hypothetical protein